MKFIIITGLGLLFSSFLHAQTDTLFFGPQDSIRFRVREYLIDQTYQLRDYDQQNRLRVKGHARSKEATIKQGQFNYFDQESKITAEGFYNKGFRESCWNFYFKGTQRIKEKRAYMLNPKGCYVIMYDSVCGTSKKEGFLDEFERKQDQWKEYYACGDSLTLHYLSNYVNGYRQGKQQEFNRNGNIKRIEYFEGKKLKFGQRFDTAGQKVKYYPAFRNAEPKVHLKTYLSSRLACFDSLLRKKDLQILFTISPTGKVLQAKVLGQEDSPCAARIESYLLKMKPWKPYLYENMPYQKELIYTIHYYTPKE